MMYFVTGMNFCAILCYSVGFFNAGCKTELCVTASALQDDDGCFMTDCITSIHGVTEFNNNCEISTGYPNVYCMHLSPSLWQAAMILMCFAMAVNCVLVVGTLIIIHRSERSIKPDTPLDYISPPSPKENSTPSLIRAEVIAVNDPASAQNTSLECKENDNNDDDVVPFVAVVVATDIASEANTPIP